MGSVPPSMKRSKRYQRTDRVKTNRIQLRRGPAIVYTVAALFALAGLADAVYLTVQFLSGETAVCGGSADCFRVLGSAYSRIGQIPVAGLGALAYFGVFSLSVFAAFGYLRARKLFAVLVWAMFAGTLWFLFVQAFLLHAFCRYCLFSAAMVFLLTGLVMATPRSS
jgi:uncharacterized membrane protein